jgi:universal stress protein F
MTQRLRAGALPGATRARASPTSGEPDGALREHDRAMLAMKRILVALDTSERAATVLDTAAQLAEVAGAKLVLYRAIHVSPDLPKTALIERGARLEDLLVNDANEELARFAARVPPALVEKSVAVFAIPWDGICRAAREHAVDLVVIGSHGYGAIDRLLGTTAAKVVNHTDRNVFVVRTV